jgi:hypothetical protein
MLRIDKDNSKDIIKMLVEGNGLGGYNSPKSGRITYNKVVDTQSFAVFTDIITSIVPLDIVNDPEQNSKIPSIARVVPTMLGVDGVDSRYSVYGKYLFLNATMDEYMDYQDEEDQENMVNVLDVVSEMEDKIPLVGVAVQKSEEMGSAHAIAFIAWKKKNVYTFAYYDPLAYKRGKKAYDFTDRAFVEERFAGIGYKLKFLDMNLFCYRSGEDSSDFHCSQYIINAEYCYVYSVYFLVTWIGFGAKINKASLRKSVKSTYIVHPAKLTRANTKESMIYRVTMMAFVCKCLLIYLRGLTVAQRKIVQNSRANIERIKVFLKEFKAKYGAALY